jgi:hypothetical protein
MYKVVNVIPCWVLVKIVRNLVNPLFAHFKDLNSIVFENISKFAHLTHGM